MNNTIHFFDLDDTLWSIDGKSWIIQKDKPNSPLIKLNKLQLTEILNGVYKKQDNSIEYNGKMYWISDNMLEIINRKNKNLELKDIGLSFIEYTNPDYYKKIHFFIENIRHLIGKENIDIGILSARHDVDNDNIVLKSLKNELENIGLEIHKFYYVSDFFENRNTNKVNCDKTKILLEHLTGYHIEDNYFLPIKQNFYQKVHFYDDELQNINMSNNIQSYLDEYLRHTDDEIFNKIKNRIIEKKPILYTHLITNNKLNRFKTTKILIRQPLDFSVKVEEKITYKFEDFIKKYK